MVAQGTAIVDTAAVLECIYGCPEVAPVRRTNLVCVRVSVVRSGSRRRGDRVETEPWVKRMVIIEGGIRTSVVVVTSAAANVTWLRM